MPDLRAFADLARLVHVCRRVLEVVHYDLCGARRARDVRRDGRRDGLRRAPVAVQLTGQARGRPGGLRHRLHDRRAIGAGQHVDARLDQFPPLGAIPQRHAGHPVERGLLLKAAGIGQHRTRGAHQGLRLQVRLRVENHDTGHLYVPHECAGPGMRGPDDGELAPDIRKRVQDAGPACWCIGVLGAVDGREGEAAPRQAMVTADLAGPRHDGLAMLFDDVEHHVAGADDARAHAFGCEIGEGGVRRREQERRHVVRQDPVGFLGHRPIEGAQAGFDVRHRDEQLGGREGAGKRRVGVPIHDDHRRPGVEEHLLDGLQHPPGLRAVRGRADLQVDVGRRDAEALEERRRHGPVVVLAGVHQHFAHPGRAQRGGERGRLHELRARPDNGHDGGRPGAHAGCPAAPTDGWGGRPPPMRAVRNWWTNAIDGRASSIPKPRPASVSSYTRV